MPYAVYQDGIQNLFWQFSKYGSQEIKVATKHKYYLDALGR